MSNGHAPRYLQTQAALNLPWVVRPLLTEEIITDPTYFTAVSRECLDYPQKLGSDLLESSYEAHLRYLIRKAEGIKIPRAPVLRSIDAVIPDCPENFRKRLQSYNPLELHQVLYKIQIAKQMPGPKIVRKGSAQGHLASSIGWYRDAQEDAHTMSAIDLNGLTAAEIATVLRETIFQVSQQYNENWLRVQFPFESSSNINCGTTLVATLLIRDEIYAAAVGDSQALLITENQAGIIQVQKLHKTHSPTIPDEASRFSPGTIINERVLGSLAVTRALGDFYYAKNLPGIFTCSPEISMMRIPPDAQSARVVLTCDSVSDVMNEMEVGQFVMNYIHEAGEARVAEALCEEAMNHRHSSDNTSVIVSKELVGTERPDGMAVLLLILDGHGVKTRSHRSMAAIYTQAIAQDFPFLLRLQVDRMIFLKEKIQEIDAVLTAVNESSSSTSLFPKMHLSAEEQGIFTSLKVALSEFKMQGDYQHLPQKIALIKETLQMQYPNAFSQEAATEKTKVEMFIEAMLEESLAWDDESVLYTSFKIT